MKAKFTRQWFQNLINAVILCMIVSIFFIDIRMAHLIFVIDKVVNKNLILCPQASCVGSLAWVSVPLITDIRQQEHDLNVVWLNNIGFNVKSTSNSNNRLVYHPQNWWNCTKIRLTTCYVSIFQILTPVILNLFYEAWKYICTIVSQHHWNRNVILTKFSSLAVLKGVILRTFNTAKDKNFVKMATFSFQ